MNRVFKKLNLKKKPKKEEDEQIQDQMTQPHVKEFFQGVVDCGLNPDKSPISCNKKILVVGAGCAGVCIAWELQRAGYKDIEVIEATNRVGGRLDTIGAPIFTDGLTVEGGGMRLPGKSGCIGTHYLTDSYMQQFGTPSRSFVNSDTHCLQYIFGELITQSPDDLPKLIKITNKKFPGWDAGITKKINKNYEILTTGQYWGATTAMFSEILTLIGWNLFMELYSLFSVHTWMRLKEGDEFVPYDNLAKFKPKGSRLRCPPKTRKEIQLIFAKHRGLRPWSEIGIDAFQAVDHVPSLDISLVELLRDDLAKWWHDPMHTATRGMTSIVRGFIKQKAFPKLTLNCAVVELQKLNNGKTRVFTKNTKKKSKRVCADYDAVFLTPTLNIVRNLKRSPDLFSPKKELALTDFHYLPSAKIMLQFKTRFWEKEGIHGGLSKTTDVIQQVKYPSPSRFRVLREQGRPTKKGILVSYTWDVNSLSLGSLSVDDQIELFLEQLGRIHDEKTVRDNYDNRGTSSVWYEEKYTNGAFALLKPYQYLDSLETLVEPENEVYLAGEALSFTNGWAQGAFASGIYAAYQFFQSDSESCKSKK